MENFNVNDNTGYLVIPRYFKTIPYRLDFSDTAQPYYGLRFVYKCFIVQNIEILAIKSKL